MGVLSTGSKFSAINIRDIVHYSINDLASEEKALEKINTDGIDLSTTIKLLIKDEKAEVRDKMTIAADALEFIEVVGQLIRNVKKEQIIRAALQKRANGGDTGAEAASAVSASVEGIPMMMMMRLLMGLPSAR